MECKCGGSMKDASVTRSKAGIVFEYQVCKACERNLYGSLIVAGKVVAVGNEAQRLFLAMDEPVPAPAPVLEPGPWTPTEQRPVGTGLIRVRFIAGGYYIERPSYFAERWDLIDAWQPYDNGPALAAALNPLPIPPELRVGTETPPAPARKARPLPPPPAVDTQRGQTLSLF